MPQSLPGLGAVQVRVCAEGQRAGRTGSTGSTAGTDTHTGTKPVKRFAICVVAAAVATRPLVITFVVGLGLVLGAMANVAVQCFAASTIDCPWINKTHFNQTKAEHTQHTHHTLVRWVRVTTCVYKEALAHGAEGGRLNRA